MKKSICCVCMCVKRTKIKTQLRFPTQKFSYSKKENDSEDTKKEKKKNEEKRKGFVRPKNSNVQAL